MKVRTQYDVLDPDVRPGEPTFELEPDPDAPDDAYTIGEHGNTVRAPDGSAAADFDDAPKAWVKPLAALSAIAFIGLTIWNVDRMASGPAPLPKPSAIQVKQTLYLGVLRVDQYRRQHAVTPESLKDADLPVNAGYSYQRVDPWHYILAFESSGAKLEYDSSVSKEAFFGKPREILSMGGTQ